MKQICTQSRERALWPGFYPIPAIARGLHFSLIRSHYCFASLLISALIKSSLSCLNRYHSHKQTPYKSYWLLWLIVFKTEANAFLDCNSWHSNETPSCNKHYISNSYAFLKFELAMWKAWSSDSSWSEGWRLVMSPDVNICARCKPSLRLERHFQHQH